MIPGEIRCVDTPLVLNEGRTRVRVSVRNSGDRPVQIGSHYHFFEVNPALLFERETARGMHLDIPAGMAVRFEPGQAREVDLVPYAGRRHVYGFRGAVMGPLDTGAKHGRA